MLIFLIYFSCKLTVIIDTSRISVIKFDLITDILF